MTAIYGEIPMLRARPNPIIFYVFNRVRPLGPVVARWQEGRYNGFNVILLRE